MVRSVQAPLAASSTSSPARMRPVNCMLIVRAALAFELAAFGDGPAVLRVRLQPRVRQQ